MRSFENWVRPLQLLSCLILASCESANNIPSPDFDKNDSLAPTVFEISPDASGILEPGNTITVTFSERVDNDSVVNGGILLYRGAVDINGNVPNDLLFDIDVSREEDVLVSTLDPVTELPVDILASVYSVRMENGNFPLGEAFVLRLSNSIKDLSKQQSIDPLTGDEVSGNFMLASEFEFLVESGGWREPEGQSFAPDVIDFSLEPSINESALIAWTQFDSIDMRVKLWAGFYHPHTNTWFDTPDFNELLIQPLEIAGSSDASGDVLQLALSSNSDGKAVASWVQTSTLTGVNTVWMSYFDGAQWSSNALLVSESVPPEMDLASSPSSKVLANGEVVISWVESSAGQTKVKARTFSAQNGFATETVFEPTGAINGVDPAMTTNGSEVVNVWLQTVGGVKRVYASAYSSVTGWDMSPQAIQTNSASGDAASASVDINSDGDGFAVWSEFDGLRTNIWRSRYASKAWAEPVLVEEDNRGDAFSPSIIMGSRNGEAQVIWLQATVGQTQIRESHFSLDADWSPSLNSIGSVGSSNATEVVSTFDGYGNVTAFWALGGGKIANRFSRSQADWDGFLQVDGGQGESLSPKVLPFALDGRILAVWREFVDGGYRLTTSVYDSLFDE